MIEVFPLRAGPIDFCLCWENDCYRSLYTCLLQKFNKCCNAHVPYGKHWFSDCVVVHEHFLGIWWKCWDRWLGGCKLFCVQNNWQIWISPVSSLLWWEIVNFLLKLCCERISGLRAITLPNYKQATASQTFKMSKHSWNY